jgi:hypothetical protein
MGEVLRDVGAYNEFCAKEMAMFWGFSLRQLPTIKLGDKTVEHPIQGEMVVSENDVKLYAVEIAKSVGQPVEAGMLHFSGHAINHLFSYQSNHEIYGCNLFKLPSEPTEHLATVEAVVSVATAWILEKKGYDGDTVVKKYFDIWGSQLEQRGTPRTVADAARGSYYTLKKMGREDFKKFVRDYQSI